MKEIEVERNNKKDDNNGIDSYLNNHPDLGFVYNQTGFIKHESNSIQSKCLPGYHQMNEGVFYSDDNELIGQIYCFSTNENKLLNTDKLLTERKKMIEKAGNSVGRIIASYVCPGLIQGSKYFFGTGFRVSPSYILTAKHVVKPTHNYLREKEVIGILKLDSIIFYPYNNAVIDQIDLKSNDLIYLNLPEQNSIDSLPEFDRHYNEGLPQQWKTKNDFVFLSFKNGNPDLSKIPVAIPHVPSDYMNQECFVIGYPINLDKFIEDNREEKYDIETAKQYFNKIQTLKKFELKTASTASCILKENQNLLAHYCPTMRGASGGIFCIFNDTSDHIYFAGIHLGGSLSLKNNFSLQITHLD